MLKLGGIMFREIQSDLYKWKERPDRLVLLIRDARQVGKTFLIEKFAGQELLTIQPNYDLPRLNYWYRDKVRSQAEVDYVILL